MLTADSDERSRLRKHFEQPFKPNTIHASFDATIHAEADRLLNDLEPDGHGEIGTRFAAPFANRMAGHMLGLSLGDTAKIDRVYSAFAAAMVDGGNNEEPQRAADSAREALDSILYGELERCRREPSDSITSQVARDPDGLPDDQIVAQLRVIMFGAIETIQASVMNALLLLLHHRSQMAEAHSDPARPNGAVAEAIRLIPPSRSSNGGRAVRWRWAV